MADYDAGRAYLAVLPSTRGFAQRLKADLAGVGQDFTVNAHVEVDQRGLAGLQAALRALPAVVLDADATPADRQIAELRARIAELSGKKIGVDVSGEQARREVAAIKADLDRLGASSADIGVRVDAGAASAALERVDRDISKVDGRRASASVDVDVNRALQSLATIALALNQVNGRSVTASVLVDTGRAVAGVAMLAGRLFALGGALGAISSVVAAIAAIGPAAAVAGVGLGAMVLGFGGIGKALSALSAQQDSAGATAQQQAKQQQAGAFAIASAQAQLSRAAEASSQARQDAARGVADAEKQASRSVESALIAQAAAHRTLRQATSDLEREQKTLSLAWEEGRRALQDLQSQVRGNSIDQRQAAVDLRDAEKALAAARASGNADAIERATIAYDRQRATVDDLRTRGQRLADDNAAAQAKGVAGSTQVVAANQRIVAAQQRVSDASIAAGQADLAVTRARTDGAQAVARAQESGTRQIAAADQALADANRSLAQVLSQTGDAGQSAANQVAQAFANLSPPARAFALYLWSLKPALDALRASAAAGLLPPIQAGLVTLMGQFSVFQAAVGQAAAGIGGALGYVLTILASPFWVGFFTTLGAVSGPILGQLAVVFMALAQAVAGLILALLPFTPLALQMLGLVAGLVAAWTPFIAMFAGQLLPVFGMLLTALMPLGPVLGALAPILAVLGQAFSMVLGAVLTALAPVLVALTPLIGQLALAFAGQLVAAIQSLTPFLVGLARFMSEHPALVMGVITVVAGLLTGWGLLRAAVGALLSPLLLIRLGMMLLGTSVSGLLGPLVAGAGAVGGFITSLASNFSFLSLGGVLIRGIGMAISAVIRAVLGALGPVGMLIAIFGFLFATNEQFRGAVLGLLGVLGQLVGQIVSSLAPAFAVVGQIMSIFGGVIGALAGGLATALVPIVQALADLLTWLSPVIVPLVDVFLAVRTAMLLWAAAQWALNIAMDANPIGLIVLAVAALVGAVVWAYQNVGWFRDAVNACWAGVQVAFSAIGAAAVWLWQTIFVPAWNAIAAVVGWAWTNILQPVLSAIWTGLLYLGAILFTIIVAPFIIAWNLISAAVDGAWIVIQAIWGALIWFAQNVLGPVISALYTNVVKPVWDAIGAAISFVWNSIILPVWNALVWVINNVLIPSMQFYYYNVILPIWNAIGAAISFVWNSIILPVWNALVWVINNVLIPATLFFYNSVILPIWNAIGAAIMFVWTNVISPAFQAVWGGLQWLGDRFRDGVGFIQRIWDGIRGILARPINFMIDVVWNRGILTAWNKVAGLIGIPAVQPLGLIPEFATGGPVDAVGGGLLSGPGTGTSDSILARVSTDEYVVRAVIARQVPNFLDALNAGQPEAVQAAGGATAAMPGFGQPAAGARSGGPIPFYAAGGRVLPRFVDGGPVARAQAFARSQDGKPYQWGGTGNPSWDCSGFMSGIVHALRGESPFSGRLGTTNTMPWGGFTPGLAGAFTVGNSIPHGHMAGTLGGVNVESGGSNGVHFGGPAIGADNGLFEQKWTLPQVGGQFVSGGGGGGGGSWFNPLPELVRAAFSLTDIPLGALRALTGAPPPEYKRVPGDLATKMRDQVRDWLVQKAEFSGGGGGGPAPAGQVNDWITQALGILGYPANFAAGIFQQIMTESGGNPAAVQHGYTDVNSISGDLAKGIMQVIGATFRANALPGHGDIFNPVDNIIAGSRYAMGRYGPSWFAPGPQHSHGYDEGGLAYGQGVMLKRIDAPERVLPPRETQAYPTLTRLTQELEAGRVPTASLANAAAQARGAMVGAITDRGPTRFELVSGRLELGDGWVELVDARIELEAAALNNGRRI